MKIKYFAWVKDITNKEYEIIQNDYPKNINQLKKYIQTSYPNLQKHIKKNVLRFAVNMEYTSTNIDLDENDEIAIFPQVSGG